jgi:hypothetical protein
MIIVNVIPGTEVPGYFHGVPLGRKNWLISISGNDSNTDDDNRDHFYNGM